MAEPTTRPAAAHGPAPTNTMKKGKAKKNADPAEASKQIAAKIAQLEHDAAGDKETEVEIEREVKKANRELGQLLQQIESPMSRLETVQKKWKDLLGDMKRLEREHQKTKKRADQLQKEKDSAKSELNKMTSMKDRLEKLSRETNNENKRLRADLHRLEHIDGQSKLELHNRLEAMIGEVEAVCQARENPPEPVVNMDLDELFKEKFKSFIDQYEMRELQYTSMMRVKDLELSYEKAKLEEERKKQQAESSKSHQLTRQVSTFSQTETELRSQLNIYVEKFKQVEDTLNNSNDLFLTFRKEMEEMSKKTKRLEKENLTLTRKQEATNRNILEMAQERDRDRKEIELLRKKNTQLENLCRSMQAQGRGQVAVQHGDDEDDTESDYEYEDEEVDVSGEDEYDDDTEEEAIEVRGRRPYGPVPPPPPAPQGNATRKSNDPQHKPNGQVNGQVNGVKR